MHVGVGSLFPCDSKSTFYVRVTDRFLCSEDRLILLEGEVCVFGSLVSVLEGEVCVFGSLVSV